MAPADIATQYIVIIVTTLIFTVLSIDEPNMDVKSTILTWFTGIMWMLSGFANFLAGDTTSILTYGLTYLFIGFGFFFFVIAFYYSVSLFRLRKPQI